MSLCSRALVVAFVFFTVATAHVSAALGPSPLNPCPESLFRVSSTHFGAAVGPAVAALLVKNAASFILQTILPSNKDPQQEEEEEENMKDSSFSSPSQAAATSVLVLNRHHQLMQDRETQLRTPPCSSPLRISALQNLFKLTKALHSNRPSHPFVREDRTPKDLTTFCRAL